MEDKVINKADEERIRSDAITAIDALTSLVQAPTLSSKYIAEKSGSAQNCLDFIKLFAK